MICAIGPLARIALIYRGAGFARDIFAIHASQPFIVTPATNVYVTRALLPFAVTERAVII